MATIEQVTFGLVESDAPAPQWLEDLVQAVMAADAGDIVLIGHPICSFIGCDHPGIHPFLDSLYLCDCHSVAEDVEVIH